MSISVARYPKTPYRQTPIAWPVKLFDPPSQKPAGVVLSFDWSVYFALVSAQLGSAQANIAVTVDLNSGGTSQGGVIDKIVTVKIDNSNSAIAILVNFQDSGDTISCPPQTIVTLPCTTNGANCSVIAQGLAAGFLPQTTITFYNYFIPPSVDPVVQLTFPQWIGTPSIQRNQNNILTPGYGAPALGDQTFQLVMGLISPLQDEPLWGSPYASGFLYITTIDLQLIRAFVNAGAERLSSMVIESTGSAGQLYTFNYYISNSLPVGFPMQPIYTMPGMNLKLDATQTWQLRNTDSAGGLADGRARFISNFTYQP